MGILPRYRNEGYLFVPDVAHRQLHILRYEVAIISGASEPYRNLKTSTMKVLPFVAPVVTPSAIKLQLVEEYSELPNPATWNFHTELDFPFRETILPIAKRKFLRAGFGSA